MLDTIQMHQNMTAEELNQYIREKERAGTLTIFEANLAQYTKRQQTDKDMFKHWVEKHIPNAPQRTELEHSGYVGQVTFTGNETLQELEKIRKTLLV